MIPLLLSCTSLLVAAKTGWPGPLHVRWLTHAELTSAKTFTLFGRAAPAAFSIVGVTPLRVLLPSLVRSLRALKPSLMLKRPTRVDSLRQISQ